MLDFLRTHKRQMLAIMGVFLMITFIIPSYNKYKDEFGNADFGKIGDYEIQKTDIDLVKRDLDVMNNWLTDKDGINPMGEMLCRHIFGRFLIMDKEYIDDANTLARLMLSEKKDRDISYYIRQFDDLEADYDARNEYWQGKLPNSSIKSALLSSSQRMAKVFFKAFREEFIPALQAGDQNQAIEVLSTRMASAAYMHLYTLQQLEQQAYILSISLARQFIDKPIDYFILLDEAKKLNIQINPTEVNQIVDRYMRADANLDYKDTFAAVVSNWMMVMGAFERQAAMNRESPIASAYQYFGPGQKAKFQVVEFKSTEYPLDVSPTTAQLEELFNKYKDKNPQLSEDGLGYLYPNRVRVHYVKIPYDLALKSVTADEAAEYFYYNQQKAPTTRASTQPTTREAFEAPTTLPWKLDNDTDKWARQAIAHERVAAIAKEVMQGMNAEWTAYKEQLKLENDQIKKENEQLKLQNKPLKPERLIPKDPPKTELGVPYLTEDKAHEIEFLDKLKFKVEESKEAHGVKVTIIGKNDLMTTEEIAVSMPDIGLSQLNGGEFIFCQYITQYVEQLADEKIKRSIERNPQIQLMEIGRASRQAFTDTAGNMYVFRVVEADKSREPKNLDEVKARVTQDWKVLQSYDLAKKAAEKFFASAKADGLEKAAEANGMKDKVIRTDWIKRSLLPMEIQKLPSVAPAVSADFVVNAFKTYGGEAFKKQQPSIVNFSLPRIGAAYVVQIADSKPAEIPYNNKKNDFLIQTESLPKNVDFELVFDWFDTYSIRDRNHYKTTSRQ